MAEKPSVNPGDRFVQVFPPSGAGLVVERMLDDGRVAVRRDTGARQVFPASTITCGCYWVPNDDCS